MEDLESLSIPKDRFKLHKPSRYMHFCNFINYKLRKAKMAAHWKSWNEEIAYTNKVNNLASENKDVVLDLTKTGFKSNITNIYGEASIAWAVLRNKGLVEVSWDNIESIEVIKLRRDISDEFGGIFEIHLKEGFAVSEAELQTLAYPKTFRFAGQSIDNGKIVYINRKILSGYENKFISFVKQRTNCTISGDGKSN